MKRKKFCAMYAAIMISCMLPVCAGCQNQKVHQKEGMPTPPPTGAAKEETKEFLTIKKTNIYSEPFDNSNKIDTLDVGIRIEVIKDDGVWYKIKYKKNNQNVVGHVEKNHVNQIHKLED